MSDSFRTAADSLLTLKPQFEQFASFGWGCEASFWLPAARPKAFNGWEPLLHEADSSTLIYSTGLNLEPKQLILPPGQQPPTWAIEVHLEGDAGNSFWMSEPACYGFDIRTGRERPTPADCEALQRFKTAAAYAGNCLRSIDLSRLSFADSRTLLAQGESDAFWLLVVFDLAWQSRPGGLLARRKRQWRAGPVTHSIPYEWTCKHLKTLAGQSPGTPPDRFYGDLLACYPDKLPEFFLSKLDGIATASALAVGALAADLRRLADEKQRMMAGLDTEPFKAMTQLAGTIFDAERDRFRTNRRLHEAYFQHIRDMEIRLIEAGDKCLRAWAVTGCSAEEVERRVAGLRTACVKLMLWERMPTANHVPPLFDAVTAATDAVRRLSALASARSPPAAGSAPPPADAGGPEVDGWLTVSQAATLSGLDKGTISRWVARGDVKSNGQKGRKRRIDSADFNRYLLRRAENPERTESNAAVERKLKKAQQPRR
jgi:excisionase family DNA binding protein